MRKNSKTSLRSLVMVLVFGVQGIAGVAVTTFSCNQKAPLNESFSITCNITGTIDTGIQWLRPDGIQVIDCSSPTSCLTFVTGYTVTTANNSENVLEIANVKKLDSGNWTCQDGAGGKKGCEIIVQKSPTYELTILSSQSTYAVGDTLAVSVDVQDYYCSRAPSFHLMFDSQRLDLETLPSTPSTILSGTQNKSITVTEDMTGSIKLVYNCRDGDLLPGENKFTVIDTTPEPTTATPTSTATTTSTEITKPVCENVIICIIVGCIGGVAVVTVIFICCCCCPCCLPSCFPSKCPCCCRGACKKRKTSSVKGGTNGQRRTSSAEGKERVPIDDYPTSEKTGGDYLKKRNGGVDSEDILIKIPDGQSDGMRDDRVPKPDGRSEVGMHRL